VDRNLLLLTIGAAIRTLGAALYLPFLALFLLNVLHLSYLEVGVIVAGVSVVQLPFGYLGGLLADRFERRRLITLGLLGEAVATAALAYAFFTLSLPGSILAALCVGLAGSIGGPAQFAYIADLAEGSARTRGFTLYRVGFNVGFSAGVALGGVLIAFIGFAGAVAIAALIIGTGGVFVAYLLPPSGWEVDRAARRGAPSAPGHAALRPRERSFRDSFAILRKDRIAVELLFAFGLAVLVAGQWAVIYPVFVHNILGIPYATLGIGLALNGLIVVFGQSATTEGVIGRRLTTVAIAGTACYAIAFLALGAAGAFVLAPLVVFFVSVVVLTVGENLLSIPQTTLPSNLAPRDEIGSYNGAFNAVAGIGFLLAVLLGSAVLSVTADPIVIWVLLVLPAIPAALLFFHAGRRLAPAVDRA
jgi:MFS family permease